MSVSRMKKRVPALMTTAYHEAGHAVAHLVLGRGMKAITIAPNKDAGTLGHCENTPHPSWFQPDALKDERSQQYIIREIIALYAGERAEAKIVGRRNFVGSRSDREKAIDLADYCCSSNEEAEAFLNWLYIRSGNLIETCWNGVIGVAEELLKLTTLTGKQARAAFVDGITPKRQYTFKEVNGVMTVDHVADAEMPNTIPSPKPRRRRKGN